MKTQYKKIFFNFLVALVWSGATFAADINIASVEDAFRSHLASKGVIKPTPQGRDLLKYMLVSSVSLKQCGNLGVKDTPDRVSNNDLSFYRIDFDNTPSLICQDSPSPEACQAISRNCLAYGRALFCDVAYLDRLRRIAEATYFTRFRRVTRVYEGITENAYENISPFVLRDIAMYEQLIAENPVENVTRGEAIGDIEHLFNCTSDQSSTRLVPFIVASILLGHEIAHMVEFACPASEGTNDIAQYLLDTYKVVTCQDIAWNEMLADVQSMNFIEIPLLIAESVDTGMVGLNTQDQAQTCDKYKLESLGISMSGAEVAKAHLKNENQALIIMTVANLVEYEIASFGGISSALDAYESAIDLHNNQASVLEVNEYFINHAKNNLTESAFQSMPHGLPALRGMGLLAGVNFPDYWGQSEREGIANTVLQRLSGLIVGQIAKGNMLGCGADESQAENMGWRTLSTIMGQDETDATTTGSIQYIRPIETRISLRSTPMKNLTREAVAALVKRFDFYTHNWSSVKSVWDNPTGKGIKSDFMVTGDSSVIYDGSTGLMWEQSGSTSKLSQREMKDYIAQLNQKKFAGYGNWRLPTLEEAITLIKPKTTDSFQNIGSGYIDAKFDPQQQYIFTSDLWSGYNVQRWYVYFNIGNLGHSFFSEDSRYAYVRAVRSAK